MQYYYQTDLYNIKSPNRKAQAITMMGNNTSTTVAEDTPSSISAPGRRVSSIPSAGSRSSRISSSSPAGNRRSSSRLNSASTTVDPPVQVQVQAPAPIAQMFPAHPNPDHLPAPINPIGMTPLQIWNTVPNAIIGSRATALAMASNPPSAPVPHIAPSVQNHIFDEEDEYVQAQVGDEEMADDEDDDSDLEQHINDVKQHRDSLILELMRVQAATITTTTTNKTKTTNTTTNRRQPSRKSKKMRITMIALGRTQRKRVVVVSDDAPARNTRSRRAGRGGAQFGVGELEVFLRGVRGRGGGRGESKRGMGS